MKNYYTYFGVIIFRNTEPNKLRWTARLDNGARLSADTLTGIKELIKELVK